MALKIVLLALLVCCAASEAQSQGDDTSLPLSYNATELQGAGATCPNDQLRQEARENITTDIRSDIQDAVFPSILLSQGYTRVAYLNMTDSSHQCPAGWQIYGNPNFKRACGRYSYPNTYYSCVSVLYPTNGISYSRVCGRIIAYQYCATVAFGFYSQNPSRTIDDPYVDGVSITHGNPREHVWTFASAYHESYPNIYHDQTCPCTNTNYSNNANILIPPFVGDDYFCDTGSATQPTTTCNLANAYFIDDPLWDGEGCGPTSTCCELNNPPWFCKTLPVSQPVTDDIEVRICGSSSSSNRDVPIELLELYVY